MISEGTIKKARHSSMLLSMATNEHKNAALKRIIESLEKNSTLIIDANKKDMEAADASQLAMALRKRLSFDEQKLSDVITGIRMLIQLDDPSGKILSVTSLDTDLVLRKVSCPFGLIGVIFESRPDALVQIACLCLKSGNAVLLKGGSEAANTNRILKQCIESATASFAAGWIQLLESRDDVNEMLKMDKYIDLIIPRGSNEFVRYIMNNTSIPVLGHADGVCHVYIDAAADQAMALAISCDSKCQYVAVCNAAETILVHSTVAPAFLVALKAELDRFNVIIHGCKETCRILSIPFSSEPDWRTEYLDYNVSVKIVNSLNEAIEHINTYGSGHTDCIVTNDEQAAAQFMNHVDSANVFHNASTRFSDGYRYGLGAEVGISTNKVHARGPVGLEGLVTYKWKLTGNGNLVADYAQGKRTFKHKKIS